MVDNVYLPPSWPIQVNELRVSSVHLQYVSMLVQGQSALRIPPLHGVIEHVDADTLILCFELRVLVLPIVDRSHNSDFVPQ